MATFSLFLSYWLINIIFIFFISCISNDQLLKVRSPLKSKCSVATFLVLQQQTNSDAKLSYPSSLSFAIQYSLLCLGYFFLANFVPKIKFLAREQQERRRRTIFLIFPYCLYTLVVLMLLCPIISFYLSLSLFHFYSVALHYSLNSKHRTHIYYYLCISKRERPHHSPYLLICFSHHYHQAHFLPAYLFSS